MFRYDEQGCLVATPMVARVGMTWPRSAAGVERNDEMGGSLWSSFRYWPGQCGALGYDRTTASASPGRPKGCRGRGRWGCFDEITKWGTRYFRHFVIPRCDPRGVGAEEDVPPQRRLVLTE